MPWYEDLSPCDYYGEEYTPYLLAVGWLSDMAPYAQGSVSQPFCDKLAELLEAPWQPAYSPGVRHCVFCRLSGGPSSVLYRRTQRTIPIGNSTLLVPGNGFLYVAPSTIIHYIDSHAYAPPDEFCEAVLRCPPMRSMEYFGALLANGPKTLIGRDG